MLGVKSDIFRVSSLGQFKDARGGIHSRQIDCVLKRQQDKAPLILYWHEN